MAYGKAHLRHSVGISRCAHNNSAKDTRTLVFEDNSSILGNHATDGC